MLRFILRFSPSTLERMDAVAPPAHKKRSPFLRQALLNFLMKPAQPLADRPHIAGREGYKKICAILDADQLSAVKNVYPEVSVSVVIQAAVLTELARPKYKKQANTRESQRADTQDSDDAGAAVTDRKPKAARSKP